MKTNILKISFLCLLKAFLLSCSADDDSTEPETPIDQTFEQVQASGYEAMNGLFSSLGNVAGETYDIYKFASNRSELSDNQYQNVNAQSYFEQFVTPFETAIEENILNQ